MSSALGKGETKFLADENIPALTVRLLSQHGIEIVELTKFGKGLEDENVLELAFAQDRVLITFDKDFGELAYRYGVSSKGVILLRFVPRSPEDVAEVILNLVSREIELQDSFTVVERHRIRNMSYPNGSSRLWAIFEIFIFLNTI